LSTSVRFAHLSVVVTKEQARPVIESRCKDIGSLDDKTIGEVVGVAHALDDMRKALRELDACLDRREFEEATRLGYGSISSAYVFLQRTLGGLNDCSMQKQCIVQDVARELRCSYDEALPHVDAVMVSPHPKKKEPPEEQAVGEALVESLTEAVLWARGEVELPTREVDPGAPLRKSRLKVELRKRLRHRLVEPREKTSALAHAQDMLAEAMVQIRQRYTEIHDERGAAASAKNFGAFDMLSEVVGRTLHLLVSMIGKGPDGVNGAADMLRDIVDGAVREFERGYGGKR
jgi:hypothetical protein